MRPPFQALSLDLWYTTISFDDATWEIWRRERSASLRELLEFPEGFPEPEALAEAQRQVRAKEMPDGEWRETLHPSVYLQRLAEVLGGRLRMDPEEAGARFSDAGLREGPPRVNPEATRLVRELSAQGVPVVATTNTGRCAESWRKFFEERQGPSFRAIVTSCEVGRGKPSPKIFEAASAALGLPSSSVLHVGDRWDADVEGARAAGMGRGLYRGLWDRYTEEDDRDLNLRLDDGGQDVLRIGSLEELLREDLFRPPEAPPTRGPLAAPIGAAANRT